MMSVLEKISFIADWTFENDSQKINRINKENGEKDFPQIEKMIDEKLPIEFTQLYSNYNGEVGNSNGIFFGLEFINTKKILSELDFSLSLIKPKDRKIINPKRAQKILKEISVLYYKSIPNKRKYGLFKRKWKNANFNCENGAYSGITVNYENGSSENYSLNKKYSNKIFALVKELYEFEKDYYNWDSLEFVLLPNGKFSVERKDYIWENEIDFTSCPIGCIKKKYFHYKWLPIFHDFGGNFIGIDLDPGEKGKKGQIIIFGRDEENMVVIADNFEEFLDLSIKEIKENPKQFITGDHIHEVFKRIVNCV